MGDRTAPDVITYTGNNMTVRFAADELCRYLSMMTGRSFHVAERSSCDSDVIILGTYSDLCLTDIPSVKNPVYDDSIYVDISDGRGTISGSNPRSVLLAVYRYLTSAGCRWVRPGPDGEYIPRKGMIKDASIIETPSYRHRGVCIEGYTGYEHVAAMIDWIPKLGFNTYFIQFRDGFAFFDRYYSHQDNPYIESRSITPEEARVYTSAAVDEINKRGLILHMAGHGWTGEATGISDTFISGKEYDVPPDSVPLLAMVDGVRGLWKGNPVETNLCYSNPSARKLIIDSIIEYAEANRSVDVIHFWLADGANNSCECSECSSCLPSDFYLQMLNDLDAALTAKDLSVKIVFLVYNDLLWPPTSGEIKNQDRFILMFAPSSRTYSEPFKPLDGMPDIPDFTLNKLQFPSNINGCLAFLKRWQSIFPSDSFDFDYHLLFDPVNDPGHMGISNIIHKDMKALRQLGLDGYISCQLQRIALPTGFAMDIMGKTLWNTDLDFDKEADDYFDGAFGEDGHLCRDYLSRLSSLFDPVYMRGEKPVVSESSVLRFRDAARLIDDFIPLIEKNRSLPDPCQRQSWVYLWYHAVITRNLVQALEERASGESVRASEIWSECSDMIKKLESVLHKVLDVQFFSMFTEMKFTGNQF